MFSLQRQQQKNHKIYKRTGKRAPFKGEKKKSTETFLEKDLTADLLDNYFKTTILKMFKEQMKHVKKVNKTMYERNRNINKKIENVRRNQKEMQELKSIITKIF